MRLICPSCGAIHSAEAWLSDADARQCLIIVSELPWEVSRRCFNYLALFRPGPGKGLIWPKTLRLLADLKELVAAPQVKWDQNPPRANSARAWAMAMEKIIELPPKKLPLKSHGYLNAIAWEIADEIGKQTERRESAAVGAGPRACHDPRACPVSGNAVRENKGVVNVTTPENYAPKADFKALKERLRQKRINQENP